jgi:hypothetical protein
MICPVGMSSRSSERAPPNEGVLALISCWKTQDSDEQELIPTGGSGTAQIRRVLVA